MIHRATMADVVAYDPSRAFARGIRRGGLRNGLRSGSRPKVTPKTIFGSSLELWLRADMGITLNSGNVSAWADQSGKGDANRNVTQGTAALQPQYTASKATYNNQAVIDFGVAHADGELLASGTWASPIVQPITRFLVGHAANSSTNNYMMDARPGQANQAALISAHTGPAVQVFDGIGLSSGSVDIIVPTVNGISDNGASTKYYRSALTAETTGNAGTNGYDGTTIGNYLGGGNFSCKGPIAEVIIVSGAFDATKFAACMRYLGARYGIAIGP